MSNVVPTSDEQINLGKALPATKRLSFAVPPPALTELATAEPPKPGKSLDQGDGRDIFRAPPTRRKTAPGSTKELLDTPIDHLSAGSRRERQFRLSRASKTLELEEAADELSLRLDTHGYATALNLQRHHGMLVDVVRRERRRLRGNPLRFAPPGVPLDSSRNADFADYALKSSGEFSHLSASTKLEVAKKRERAKSGPASLDSPQDDGLVWSPLQGNASMRVLNTKKLSQRRSKKDELAQSNLLSPGAAMSPTSFEASGSPTGSAKHNGPDSKNTSQQPQPAHSSLAEAERSRPMLPLEAIITQRLRDGGHLNCRTISLQDLMREEEEEQQATVIERVKSSTGEVKELRRQRSRRFTQKSNASSAKLDTSFSSLYSAEGEGQFPDFLKVTSRASSIALPEGEQAEAPSSINPFARGSRSDLAGDADAEHEDGSPILNGSATANGLPNPKFIQLEEGESGTSSLGLDASKASPLSPQPSVRVRNRTTGGTVFINVPDDNSDGLLHEPQVSGRYAQPRQSMTLRRAKSMAQEESSSTLEPLSDPSIQLQHSISFAVSEASNLAQDDQSQLGATTILATSGESKLEATEVPKVPLTEEQKSKIRVYRKKRVFQDTVADLSAHPFPMDYKLLDIVKSVSSLFPLRDKREEEEERRRQQFEQRLRARQEGPTGGGRPGGFRRHSDSGSESTVSSRASVSLDAGGLNAFVFGAAPSDNETQPDGTGLAAMPNSISDRRWSTNDGVRRTSDATTEGGPPLPAATKLRRRTSSVTAVVPMNSGWPRAGQDDDEADTASQVTGKGKLRKRSLSVTSIGSEGGSSAGGSRVATPPDLVVPAFLGSGLDETARPSATKEYSSAEEDQSEARKSALVSRPPRASLLARPPASDVTSLDVIETDDADRAPAPTGTRRKRSSQAFATTVGSESESETPMLIVSQPDDASFRSVRGTAESGATKPGAQSSGSGSSPGQEISPIIPFQAQDARNPRRESSSSSDAHSTVKSPLVVAGTKDQSHLSPFSTVNSNAPAAPPQATGGSPGDQSEQRQRSGSDIFLSSDSLTPVASPTSLMAGSRQNRHRRRSTMQAEAGLSAPGSRRLSEQSLPPASPGGRSLSLVSPPQIALIRNVEDLELLTTGVAFRNEVRLIMLKMIIPDCEKLNDEGKYDSEDEFEGTPFGVLAENSTSLSIGSPSQAPLPPPRAPTPQLGASRRGLGMSVNGTNNTSAALDNSGRARSPQARALTPAAPPVPKKVPPSRRVNVESPYYVMRTVAESSRQVATGGTGLVSSGTAQSPSPKDAAAIAEANAELAAANALTLQRNAPSVVSLPATGVRPIGQNLSPSDGARGGSHEQRGTNRLADLVLKSGKHAPGQDARNRAATTSLLTQVADNSMHIFVSAAEVDWVVRRTNLLAKAKREERLEAKRAREQEGQANLGLAGLAKRLLEDEKSKNHADEFDDLLRERQECLMETLSAWYARISFRLLETEEDRRARADRLDGGTSITVPDAQTAGGCFAFAASVGCCTVS